MALLNEKYKPQLLSELEIEYPIIEYYLKQKKTFIVNGSKNCGKSTIIKLYLKLLNYDFLYIDDYSLSKDYIIDKVKYRNKSVLSFFYDKKFITIIDNFDKFSTEIKDYIIKNKNNIFIIITNSYLNSKINYVHFKPYSQEYLNNLFVTCYFLEKNQNCNNIPIFTNINELFSTLEYNIIIPQEPNKTSNTKSVSEKNKLLETINFDKFKFNYDDFILEKDFIKKLYIIDKFDNYSIYNTNLIHNFDSIENYADCLDFICESTLFYNKNLLEYYSILNLLGSSINLNKNFKILNENIYINKKKFNK